MIGTEREGSRRKRRLGSRMQIDIPIWQLVSVARLRTMNRGFTSPPQLMPPDHHTHQSPFSRLPTELVLHIFYLAVFSSPDSAWVLSRVCTWSRTIAFPHAWATLVLRASKISKGRTRTAGHFQSRRFPAHCGPLVHSLWIEGAHDARQLRSVFDTCRSVSTISLAYDHWQILTQSTYLWDGQQPSFGFTHPGGAQNIQGCTHYPLGHLQSPCRSLTVTGPWVFFVYHDDGWKTRIGCSIFASLTHLHLLHFEPRTLPMLGLPTLTHLCVPRAPRRSNTIAGLEGVDDVQLKMVIITLEESITPEILSLLVREDTRFFAIQYSRRISDALPRWQKEIRGGLSLWDEAITLRYSLLGDIAAPADVLGSRFVRIAPV